MIKKMIIDGITYVPEKPLDGSAPIKIVELKRGWVFIGNYSRVGSDCTLTNAYIIRRWGEDIGLGHLALKGKVKDTLLEYAGTITFDILIQCFALDCDQEIWERELNRKGI